jgi:hypothetical protein
MQPGGKGRFSAKCFDLPEQLQEDVLGKIFRVGSVCHHAQAQGVNLAAVHAIDSFKGGGIALLRQVHDIRVSQHWKFGWS